MTEPAREPLRPVGPHPVDDDEAPRPGALAPREHDDRPHFALPLAAMAEALRANAEALRRIDANQRKIAASIEKGDKATRLVSSTRNLNETFRNLGEIQRGLLDALVRDRAGGRGIGWIALVGVLLALPLGWLISDRFGGTDTGVSPVAWEQAQARIAALGRELEAQRTAAEERGEGEAAWRARYEQESERAAGLARENETAAGRLVELEEQLAGKEASLQEYLAMKDLADQAGQLLARNGWLEREMQELQARVAHSEKERERLLGLLAEAKLASMGGDPEAIRRSAEELGVIDPPAAEGLPGGPVVLSGRDRRVLIGQVNRLLRQARGEDSWELLDFGAIEGGALLREARLGRYRDAVLVGTVLCSSMELHADPGKDTLELRLFEGAIVNTSRPGERIPLAEGGHSIFLREAGLADWLRRSGGTVEVAGDGRLTWRTPPP